MSIDKSRAHTLVMLHHRLLTSRHPMSASDIQHPTRNTTMNKEYILKNYGRLSPNAMRIAMNFAFLFEEIEAAGIRRYRRTVREIKRTRKLARA